MERSGMRDPVPGFRFARSGLRGCARRQKSRRQWNLSCFRQFRL